MLGAGGGVSVFCSPVDGIVLCFVLGRGGGFVIVVFVLVCMLVCMLPVASLA